MIPTILHSRAAQGMLSGFLAAFAVDLHAFLTWKDPNDLKTWNWRLASLRWAQGIVSGLIGSGVLGLVS